MSHQAAVFLINILADEARLNSTSLPE